MIINKIHLIVLMGIVVCLFQKPLDAQVLINEFSAINTGAIVDFEGETPDWIEIYNANSTPYNLEGYHISRMLKI